MDSTRESALDVASCEREPIHAPQAIQPDAALLLFRPDSVALASASDNLQDMFGASASDLIGHGPEAFLCAEDAAILRRILSCEAPPVARYYQLSNGADHWVNLFWTDGLLGFEIRNQEASQAKRDILNLDFFETLTETQAKATNLTDTEGGDIKDFAELVVSKFRDISGYDRVMMYRFDTDWNGEIIAESRDSGLTDSYLGLWFPSSDIPRQARKLFQRNRVRPVADALAAPVPLVPPVNPLTGLPADLSDCSARAVSPVHVEYLRNMGVRATLNIALIVRGDLWGLLTCHHYSAPFHVAPDRMAACRMLCETTSATLSRMVERFEAAQVGEVRGTIRLLRSEAMRPAQDPGFFNFINRHAALLTGLLECDGLMFWRDKVPVSFGTVPDDRTVEAVRHRLRTQMQLTGRDGFSTHFAVGLWSDLAGSLAGPAAGVLSVRPADDAYELIAFRVARPAAITWGGDPYKLVQAAESIGRLHPRRSFDLWREETKNRARPWSFTSLPIARELAAGLAEIDWIFDWRRTEAQLAKSRAETEHAALHDPLTDLPNRRYLTRELEARVGTTAASPRPIAILHVDLDRFKQINDTLGHLAGDAVLRHVADTLRRCARREDFIARIGGDEFVIVADTAIDQASLAAVAERVVTTLSRPFDFEGKPCRFGASVGIAIQEEAMQDPGELLNRADIALYEAKRNGRGRTTVFTREMAERVRTAQRLGEEIEEGIRLDQFEAWYQPQMHATTFELAGVEALLRWNHPVRGVVSPGVFLPPAEDIGVTAMLDGIVLEMALKDHAMWSVLGTRVDKISTNVSAFRLRDPELLATLRTLQPRHGLIAFELLETINFDEIEEVMSWNIDGLRDMGVDIEVDDFGTGKTSIVGLLRLRPSRLKIDRQIVEPATRSAATRKLISSIVDIGNSLGIGVTAEGVETMEHAHVLRDLGCSVLQGYAFARPMRARELPDFVMRNAARSA